MKISREVKEVQVGDCWWVEYYEGEKDIVYIYNIDNGKPIGLVFGCEDGCVVDFDFGDRKVKRWIKKIDEPE